MHINWFTCLHTYNAPVNQRKLPTPSAHGREGKRGLKILNLPLPCQVRLANLGIRADIRAEARSMQ